MKRFEGKSIVITGGSSGIGRATALAFGQEGADVVIADVDVSEGENTVRMIKEASGEAMFVEADVTKSNEVEALIKRAVGTYGRLDCAFNNAGIVGGAQVATADCPEETWERIISVNLKGVFLCLKYEIPQMLKQGGGAIVNMASVGGLVGVAGTAAYAASKHGVVGLTKVAALDYARSGIRINCVCPTTIRTPLTARLFDTKTERGEFLKGLIPMGRLGKPEEVAEAVLWLCSSAASFVTGHSLTVDGGHSVP